MFSFRDDDSSLLPSPVLPNHRIVGNNVGNTASYIKKPGTSNLGLIRAISVILLFKFVMLTLVIIVVLSLLIVI